ncbi:MAG: CU044_5270 family protein [Micromonosporaceae bacterium]|nr:CU044_5270 family protein [Micromonosporaceae bacterium]
MNDQWILDDLGSVLDPPTEHAPAEVRQRVLAGLTTDRSRRITWSIQPVWRVAAVGGLASLVLAGLVVISAVRIGDHGPAATAEAAEILHAAADAARQAPAGAPRSDQFVFIESEVWYPAAGERSGSGLMRSWRSVDGTRDGLVWTEIPNPDGRNQTAIPGCQNGRAPVWGEQGTLREDQTRACQPDPAYLPDLPTTARDMLSYLETAAAEGQDADSRAFAGAGRLLITHYLTADTRAAVYEAVALIPGVTAVRDVSDAMGRSGVAVVREGQGVRYDMLFDPSTHQFLGWQLGASADHSSLGAQQTRRQAILRIAVVDAPGQVP